MSFISSTFSSCFHPSKTTVHNHYAPPSPPSTNPNLITYIYHTDSGTVSLTWSRSILGRSLHVHLRNHSSFHLHIKPFLFWKKHGSKNLSHNTLLTWNLSNARFGSGPEPHSQFYLALLVDHHLTLLIGDLSPKLKAQKPNTRQLLLLKRDHVHVAPHRHRVYRTKTKFRGKDREIEIDCDGYGDNNNNNMRLLFGVDEEKVLEVQRLKWKFRGSERVEIDGGHVQISWDVHDWLFEKENIYNNNNNNNNNNNGANEGHAVFMFKFEDDEVRGKEEFGEEKGVVNVWNLGSCEWGKNGKSWSSSSLSSSHGSFGGSSSVMEWSSVEENELVVPLGFSLLVYAWKR
ncbi:uncharacterized protein LOC113848207 [Abrus precatorius]|uniref:Uncharacterized protein LOC113848207 n=1 Tax=Abrus precatorius TaxID=3816 RepID=A0A8B8JS96_ABRPR|nr:uncharacterized protein LOC113848207 [Abrus precatorius]